MGKYDHLFTLADFAKKIGVTVGAVDGWLKALEDTPERVLPELIAGNTRMYDIADLERVELEKGKTGKAIRERGYVHPDAHKALESRYWESVHLSAETKVELDKALAELETLKSAAGPEAGEWIAQVNGQAIEIADLKAELIAAGERITEQNAVIVRASVENSGFVEEIDELKAKNDALILENLSKQRRITELEATVAGFDLGEDSDPDEKLSDAYAENQELRKTIDAMSGEITAMRSAIASV